MNLHKMIGKMIEKRVYRILYDKRAKCFIVYTEYDVLTIDKQTSRILLDLCQIRNAT